MDQPSYRQTLVELLEESEDDGGAPFCAESEVELPHAPTPDTLHINEMGSLPLPISPTDLDRLIQYSEVAPFGKGLDTVVDETVRKARQVDASQIKLSQEFNDAVEQATRKLATKLGIEDWTIEPRLYKLVVYETGGFFRPHKDTEKEKGMFATLTVQLPVVGGHTGGELLLKHAGQTATMHWTENFPETEQARQDREATKAALIQEVTESEAALHTNLQVCANETLTSKETHKSRNSVLNSMIDQIPDVEKLYRQLKQAKTIVSTEDVLAKRARCFPCGAFYADCTHELAPIGSGQRVVLLYNLVRTTGTAYRNPQGAASETVQRCTCEWVEDSKGPAKLIVPLEHEYTESNFAFDALKGNDRHWADLLRSSDELVVNLVLLERHVSGTASSSGGYRGRRYYDSDNDSGEDATMEDIHETSDSTHLWISPDGGSELWFRLDECNETEVLFGDLFDPDSEPDRKEYESYTGNAGPTLDYWYYRAVLVIWPKARSVRAAFSGGLKCAIAETKHIIGESDNVAKSAMSQLLDCVESYHGPRSYDHYSRTSADDVNALLSLAESCPDSSCRMLQLFTPGGTRSCPPYARGISNEKFADILIRLVEVAGWETMQASVERLVKASLAENFKYSLLFLQKAANLANDVFIAILSAVHAASVRLFTAGSVTAQQGLIQVLVKEPLSKIEACARMVGSVLQDFCSSQQVDIATASSVLVKCLKSGLEADKSCVASLESRIRSVVQSGSALSLPCLDFLIKAGNLGAVVEFSRSLNQKVLMDAIHATKRYLSRKHNASELPKTKLKQYVDLFVELTSRTTSVTCNELTEALMSRLLQDITWGMSIPAHEELGLSSQNLATWIKSGGQRSIIFAMTSLSNISHVQATLRDKPPIQKLIDDFVGDLSNQCRGCPSVDYSVPGYPEVERILTRLESQQSSTSNYYDLRVLHGRFSRIAEARIASAHINRLLGSRGSACAQGAGRTAYVQIAVSPHMKALVQSKRSYREKFDLIKKFSPLVSKNSQQTTVQLTPNTNKRGGESVPLVTENKKKAPRPDPLDVIVID